MAILRVSNFKDCVDVAIKFFKIKYNIIKKSLIWFLFSKNKYIKVKEINVKRVGMRERIRDWFHHSSHNNGQS
jgi:hypothetical protein